MSNPPKFAIGQVIIHERFNYRGVIFDVDPAFMLSEEWYQRIALSRPPKHQPWYHVLVDNADHTTYVAERHLKKDDSMQQINHPLLGNFFSEFIDGVYIHRAIN